MRVPIKTPEFSESVQSGTLLEWRKQVGDTVERDEPLLDLETDKVILEVSAPASGTLAAIHIEDGSEVQTEDVLGEIETGSEAAAEAKPAKRAKAQAAERPQHVPPSKRSARSAAKLAAEKPANPSPKAAAEPPKPVAEPPQPAAESSQPPATPVTPAKSGRADRRVPMSRLRQRIAERMVEAQHTAAILTTFNEIDMQPVQSMRKHVQAEFQRQHGVKMGLMSLFVRAACLALKQFQVINASIDGRDIVYHDNYDIGVAVSSERGLVVPVLRDADRMNLADIELKITDFARRANSLELTLEDLEGGTFTISNGGVFGSMLSTPILNPPQSAVLGLHRIQDRPVAVDGQVVIRPMMYLALSYDHRLIDGREAVSFLKAIKDELEAPEALLV